MSTLSQSRRPKRPSPTRGVRYHGKPFKEKPINVTDFQRMLHEMSRGQKRRRSGNTPGAFGGCTREERMVRRLTRRLDADRAKAEFNRVPEVDAQ